jgi:Flp pilus assembly protein TadB
MFSQSDRQFALRCAGVAIGAILLAKERLLLLFVAMALVAVRGTIWLVIRPWSWPIFAVTTLTGVPFLMANRYWRNPKLAYQLPSEFRLVDALLSVVSICGTLYLLFLISPHKWGAR